MNEHPPQRNATTPKPESKSRKSSRRPVVLITGLAGRIGTALAETLKVRYTVVGLDRTPEEAPCECIRADLTSADSIELALRKVRERHGERIDESTPIRPAWAYPESKAAAERSIAARTCPKPPQSWWASPIRRAIRSFRWQDLRHTAVSWMVQSGVSLDMVRDILGHGDIFTTRRYAHRETNAKRQALTVLAAQLRPNDAIASVDVIEKNGKTQDDRGTLGQVRHQTAPRYRQDRGPAERYGIGPTRGT